jgi:hypothetical protein
VSWEGLEPKQAKGEVHKVGVVEVGVDLSEELLHGHADHVFVFLEEPFKEDNMAS